MKSFRTSPWDCYENLPVDYSRIFQFQNFNRTRTSVLKNLERLDPETDSSVVTAGSYVTIHIANVSAKAAETLTNTNGRPLIVFSLLAHEQKMSVVNFSVTRPSMSSLAESLAYAASKDSDMASILESSNNASICGSGINIQMKSFSLPEEYVVRSKDPLMMCVGFRRFMVQPIYSTTQGNAPNNVYVL
jgi:hypothetical protein